MIHKKRRCSLHCRSAHYTALIAHYTVRIAHFTVRIAGCSRSFFSRREALPVLAGNDECLHHLRIYEVAIELVQLAQPEVITVKVKAWLRRVIRPTAQVAEMLQTNVLFECRAVKTPFS